MSPGTTARPAGLQESRSYHERRGVTLTGGTCYYQAALRADYAGTTRTRNVSRSRPRDGDKHRPRGTEGPSRLCSL